jgi:glyoxylase-like metal-dependent hydrolase (beta-lactamase superfamily II)
MSSTPNSSHSFHAISPNVTVIERGWLNCNQILLTSAHENILIDSGYGRHAAATIDYVEQVLQGKLLHRLINTHCHSDHMGGNRALSEHYACRVTIPEGEVQHVVPWTAQSCWAEEMDQYAEEFQFDDVISAGDVFDGGGLQWRAVAAPGHDMGALMFWCEAEKILITGDALWERGMGFVWPSAEGNAPNSNIRGAFETFDVIEALNPVTVIPGHGAPFFDVKSSLEFNRSKLSALARDPVKAARNVAKSLFVFSLLDKQTMLMSSVENYVARVPVFKQLDDAFLHMGLDAVAAMLKTELIAAGAVVLRDGQLSATMRA